jgi:hypothetical protein
MYTSSAGVRDASSALDDRRDGWNDCKEGSNSLSVDVSFQLGLQNEGRTVLIFSKLGGETTEKQTRKTSVWGYERGRRRLVVSLYHFESQQSSPPCHQNISSRTDTGL